MAGSLTRMCGSFKRGGGGGGGGHRRSSSESNPMTGASSAACERVSTSSSFSGSVNSHEYFVAAAGEEDSQLECQQPAGGKEGVKRVIVVVDHSRESRLALLWALSHVVHKLDLVTLLYVFKHSSPSSSSSGDSVRSEEKTRLQDGGNQLVTSLKSLCSERRPEVEVEALVVEGDSKGATIVGQAKKLDASVLVLGQKKPGFLRRLLRIKDNGLVEYCIQNAECLTLAVRRKSRRVGGYLINTKWQRNFWLLA